MFIVLNFILPCHVGRRSGEIVYRASGPSSACRSDLTVNPDFGWFTTTDCRPAIWQICHQRLLQLVQDIPGMPPWNEYCLGCPPSTMTLCHWQHMVTMQKVPAGHDAES